MGYVKVLRQLRVWQRQVTKGCQMWLQCTVREQVSERRDRWWAGPKQAALVATVNGLILSQVQWEAFLQGP